MKKLRLGIYNGFHTVCLIWSQWIRQGYFGDEIVGGVGIENIQWKLPVYPGDILTTQVQVKNMKPYLEKGRGLIEFSFSTLNQNDKTIIEFSPKIFIKSKKN